MFVPEYLNDNYIPVVTIQGVSKDCGWGWSDVSTNSITLSLRWSCWLDVPGVEVSSISGEGFSQTFCLFRMPFSMSSHFTPLTCVFCHYAQTWCVCFCCFGRRISFCRYDKKKMISLTVYSWNWFHVRFLLHVGLIVYVVMLKTHAQLVHFYAVKNMRWGCLYKHIILCITIVFFI